MVQASLRQMNVKGTEYTCAKFEQAGLVYPWAHDAHIYICSAQSRNRYHSRMALRKVRISTWLRKVGILTLRRAILEWSLRKVRIWTK